MPLFAIDPNDATPIHAQLNRVLRAAIASGRLATGEQLPTVRQLAVDLRINANTVARVYGELERDGVLETRRGVGTFIRAAATRARSQSEHHRQLRAFVTRVAADATAMGFSLDEVVEQIRSLRKDGD